MRQDLSGVRVTVFGSSLPQPGSEAYQKAYDLGRSLGLAGATVLTGGYMGTMEAVSRGASEVEGHVIGVTCDEIETWRPVGPNPWVKEERRYPTLRTRLYALIDACDAAIALPGGIGTLAEVAAIWSQEQVTPDTPRPVILIGDGWKAVMEQLFTSMDGYISIQNRALLFFAPDHELAIQKLYSSL
jgi:uncharacterized protein (TIGR00730 family)